MGFRINKINNIDTETPIQQLKTHEQKNELIFPAGSYKETVKIKQVGQ